MRRSSLGLVLIAVNVSLALLAVAGLAAAAAALLRRFSDEQALARVRAAAISAERAIAGQGDALRTVTRLLAEHETSTEFLAMRRFAEVSKDLESFREAGELTAAAVLRGGVVVAKAGPTLDWAGIASGAPLPAFGLDVLPSGALQLACAGPLPADRAYVVARPEFWRPISRGA